jgi:hypothetical protein
MMNGSSRRTAGIASAVLALALGLSSCAGDAEARQAPLPGAQSGARFELRLEPGPEYSKDMRIAWFSYTVWPQVAVWLEGPDGSFIDTLYVTELAVSKDYTAAPKQGRPEALPVWTALKQGGADAVSSPTTVGNAVSYGNGLAARLPPGDYVVKLETNRSYDWNDIYTKKNSGVNGQPSLIYEAKLSVGKGPAMAGFKPVGTGSVDGSDGSMRPVLEGIDTALALFSTMEVAYLPE